MKNRSEYDEQCEFVDWLETKSIKFSSIPNNTYTPSLNQMRKNRAEGLRAGLPDLLLVIHSTICKHNKSFLLFIEMKQAKKVLMRKSKRGEKGDLVPIYDLSPEQALWIRSLNQVENVGAYTAYGCEEAKEIVNRFLK